MEGVALYEEREHENKHVMLRLRRRQMKPDETRRFYWPIAQATRPRSHPRIAPDARQAGA